MQVEPLGLPRSDRFMVGDKKKQFHEINGFLSLQLGLSFELGLRLRLTNYWDYIEKMPPPPTPLTLLKKAIVGRQK